MPARRDEQGGGDEGQNPTLFPRPMRQCRVGGHPPPLCFIETSTELYSEICPSGRLNGSGGKRGRVNTEKSFSVDELGKRKRNNDVAR